MLNLDDYVFALPPERIAQTPLEERDAARLMCLGRRSGEIIGDFRVRDLASRLRSGDLLVVNATRVLSARLRGQKLSGGRAEALLLRQETPPDGNRHRALIKLSGRPRMGLQLDFGGPEEPLPAEIVALHEDGEVSLEFPPGSSPLLRGESPLPPYIRRNPAETDAVTRALDRERYQTVYARVPGAVAAPTAGLHLTPALLDALETAGIGRAEVVLHVGAGTFRPLAPDNLRRDRLHADFYELPPETVEAIRETRARGGRVVAVGTTTTRVLESCAGPAGKLLPGSGETEIFLRPGSEFRVVDGLLTNFHLPRSSLLLLVAAFAGRDAILAAYSEAIAREYRFYSYGDAMLII